MAMACPGLAIGVRASAIAMDKLNTGLSEDEELVCVTENDACGVDGVQVLTALYIWERKPYLPRNR